MECTECSEEIPNKSLFCNMCGAKQKEVISHFNWNTPYGTWKVSTEGDDEGRTTKQLGIHEGYIDEIAFAFANQACYSLDFKPVKSIDSATKRTSTVSIRLDIDSKTWNMKAEERVKFTKNLLKDRLANVDVEPGRYFASVVLKKKM